jgi:hypothetical protein
VAELIGSGTHVAANFLGGGGSKRCGKHQGWWVHEQIANIYAMVLAQTYVTNECTTPVDGSVHTPDIAAKGTRTDSV